MSHCRFSYNDTIQFLTRQLDLLQKTSPCDSALIRDAKKKLSVVPDCKDLFPSSVDDKQIEEIIERETNASWNKSSQQDCAQYLNDTIVLTSVYLENFPQQQRENIIRAYAMHLHRYCGSWAEEYKQDWEKGYEECFQAKTICTALMEKVSAHNQTRKHHLLSEKDAEKFLTEMTTARPQVFFKSNLNDSMKQLQQNLAQDSGYPMLLEQMKNHTSLRIIKSTEATIDTIKQLDIEFTCAMVTILKMIKFIRDCKLPSPLYPYYLRCMGYALYLSYGDIAEKHGGWLDAIAKNEAEEKHRMEMRNSNPFSIPTAICGLFSIYNIIKRGKICSAALICTALFGYSANRYDNQYAEKKPDSTKLTR